MLAEDTQVLLCIRLLVLINREREGTMSKYEVAQFDGGWWVLREERRDSDNRYIQSSDTYYVPHATTGGDEDTAFEIANTLNTSYYNLET